MRPLTLAAIGLVLVSGSACAASTAGSGTGASAPRSATPIGPQTPSNPVSYSYGSGPSAAPPVGSTGPATSVTSTSTVPASGAGRPVPQTPLRTVSVVAADGTTYVIKVWAQTVTHDCTGVSYGKVTAFLRRHPCAALSRLLATTRVGGRDVGFAQSAVGFSGSSAAQTYRAAGNFRTLVSRNGTGNIDDLFRDGYRLPAGPRSVPYPDAFRAQAQDNTVTIVDAWYLHGPTPANDAPLVRMARDIYLQF